MKRCWTGVAALILLAALLATACAAAEEIKGSFNMLLLSGAQVSDDGSYAVCTPQDSSASKRFDYQLSYAFVVPNGQTVLPGELRFVVPRSVILDRNGECGNSYEMSIPEIEVAMKNPDGINPEVFLAYEETADGIMMTNFRELSAANYTGYVQISYQTTKETFYYPDYDSSAPALELKASMAYPRETGGETVLLEQKIPSIVLDTQFKALSAEKGYPTLHKLWQSSWGPRPDPAGEYWYLSWPVTTHIDSGSTQLYSYSIIESPGDVKNKEGDVLCGQEVVAYKLAGQDVVLSHSNRIDSPEETLILNRYDSVITRIPVRSVDAAVFWTTSNQIQIEVTPADEDATTHTMQAGAGFSYHKPYFDESAGKFTVWKRADGAYRRFNGDIYTSAEGSYAFHNSSMEGNECSRYDLNEFAEGNLNEYDGFDYAVWIYAESYPLTRDQKIWEEINAGKPENAEYTAAEMESAYGKLPVQYVLCDGTLQGESTVTLFVMDDSQGVENGLELTHEDFSFTSLQYQIVVSDAQYDEDTQSFVRRNVNTMLTQEDQLTFYACYGGSREYEKIAVVTLGPAPSAQVFVDGVQVDTENRIITLPQGTDAFMITTQNCYYDCVMGVVANLSLYPTERVLEYIADADHIAIRNQAQGREMAWDVQSETFKTYKVPDPNEDFVYARTSQRTASLEKKVVSGRNDVSNRQFVVSWCIEQMEQIRSGKDDSVKAIRQNGGVFFDLLPLGATLVESSVAVYSGNEFLSPSSFSIRQHANFRDHRTLVIITVMEPGDWYRVTFDTLHAWDIIKDIGTTADNVVAYQTGNREIAGGYPDNGAGLGAGREYLLDDLVEDDNGAKRFLYAQAYTDVSSLTSSSTGLSKRVKAVEDEQFDDETVVVAGGDYVYRLRFAADPGVGYSNMIFFDEIECEMKGNVNGEWFGTLREVDVSELSIKGIDAKVYYSERTGVTPFISDPAYVFSPEVWTLADGGTIPAQAKTIAIDMRKDVNGEDYVLENGSSVTVNLFLYAPKRLPDNMADENRYPQTYNGLTLMGTRIAEETGAKVDELRHIGPTTVEYVVAADIPVSKRSSRDSTKAIRGITFRLYGTSDYGTAIDLLQETDSRGNTVFRSVEKGTYILQEYASTPDWLLDTTEHTVVIDKSCRLTIDGELVPEGMYYTALNEPRIHGELVFTKKARAVGNYAEIGVPGISFRLSGTSGYGTPVELYETSDASGVVRFADVEMGSSYVLEELSGDWGADSAYLPLGTTLNVSISASGEASIDTTGVEHLVQTDEKGAGFIVWNERRFLDFTFYKRADGTGEFLAGAQFRLTGNADSGIYYEKTAESDENGCVRFEGIERGVYILSETKAPSRDGVNYQIDPTEYFVRIADNGTVTIEGMTFDDSLKGYVMTNEPANDNELIIYKKWVDYTADNRQPPELIVWTGEDIPIGLGCSVTYDANGGVFDGAYGQNVVRYYKDGQGNDLCAGEYKVPVYNVYADGSGLAQQMKFDGWKTSAGEAFDPAGAASLTENITVYAQWSLVMEYDCMNDVQTYTAPESGWYFLQAWGAEGGKDAAGMGGKGGYSEGYIYLSAGERLFVMVGGRGGDDVNNRSGAGGGWNGGGHAGTSGSSGGGGGMTHISLINNPVIRGEEWNADEKKTLLAAGGGGGGGVGGTRQGGYGGGLIAGDAHLPSGKGGRTEDPEYNGGLRGQGEDRSVGLTYSDGGGGGGGWYSGRQPNADAGAGGGSAYLNPVLTNARTIPANSEMPAPDGGTQIGQEDGGKVIITYIAGFEPVSGD